MADTATAGAGTIQFPVIENLGVSVFSAPALAPSPGTNALGQNLNELATPALNQKLPEFSCVSHLIPSDRKLAQQQAVVLVDKIMRNAEEIVTYGDDELVPLNDLLSELLDNEEPVSLPDLERRMRKVKAEMREIEGHASAADPDVIRVYLKWKGTFLGWIHRVEGTWYLLREDLKSLNQHINELETMLADAQRELLETIIQKGLYHDTNESEILALFRTVAIMELASIEAGRRAAAIQVTANDPLDRHSEEQARLNSISNTLAQRVTRFQARLMIAFKTAVDISGSRDLDIGLATLLGDLRRITLPSLRGTVWLWMKARKAEIYAGKANTVRDFANWANQQYGQASVSSAQAEAMANNTPLFSADTFLAGAAALDQVATIIVNAMQFGAQQSKESRIAITQSLGILAQAHDKVAAEQLRETLERIQTINVDDVIPPDFATRVLNQPAGARPSSIEGAPATAATAN